MLSLIALAVARVLSRHRLPMGVQRSQERGQHGDQKQKGSHASVIVRPCRAMQSRVREDARAQFHIDHATPSGVFRGDDHELIESGPAHSGDEPRPVAPITGEGDAVGVSSYSGASQWVFGHGVALPEPSWVNPDRRWSGN